MYPGTCTLKCPGDSSQLCGGSNDHSLLYNPAPAVTLGKNGFYGCYPDPNDPMTGLRGKYKHTFMDNAMTPGKCTAGCATYDWAMVFRGTTCYCGDDVQLGSSLFNGPASVCNTPCPGDNSQICGGLYANSVYSLTGKALIQANGGSNVVGIALSGSASTPSTATHSTSMASSAKPATTTTHTASTTTHTSSSVHTSSTSHTVTTHSTTTSRSASSQVSASHSTTTHLSSSHSTTPQSSTTHSTTTHSTNQQSPASSSHTTTSTKSAQASTLAKIGVPPVTASLTYLGCHTANGTDSVHLLAHMSSVDMTPDDCNTYCQERGDNAFGLARGTLCGCLKDVVGFTKVDEKECESPCGGKSDVMCGGQTAAGLYSAQSSASVENNTQCPTRRKKRMQRKRASLDLTHGRGHGHGDR